MTDWERAGGDEGLARIYADMVDLVFDDPIIGFFFAGKSRERIARMEAELAAVHLGKPGAVYTGRSLSEAHLKHPINQGHFRRRMAALRTVLERHGVPEDVRGRWLEHDLALQGAVTRSLDCV